MEAAEHEWHEFPDGETLAKALAQTVGAKLEEAIVTRGSALMAVSGGTTPVAFFKTLSRRKLDWPRVVVTLADERFLPTSSSRSNARLVTQHLLQSEASRAGFVGLYHETQTVDEAAAMADRAVSGLPLPFDVVVLGMGKDAHTASFFPDAENIDKLLAANGDAAVVPVTAPSASEPRLTIAMKHLADARFLALHIQGEDKKNVLKGALARGPMPTPVRALIERAATPVQIYWAPKKDATS